MKDISKKEISATFFVAFSFLIASYFSETVANFIEPMLYGEKAYELAIYFVVVVILVLIPLASSIPLIPIAVELWGRLSTVGILYLAWVLSGIAGFAVARRIGKRFVLRFASVDKLNYFENLVSKQNIFSISFILGVVGAPIDLLSYSLGMLTKIPMWKFMLPFSLGMIPFAFSLTYVASLPTLQQTYLVMFLIVAWVFIYRFIRSNGKDIKDNN